MTIQAIEETRLATHASPVLQKQRRRANLCELTKINLEVLGDTACHRFCAPAEAIFSPPYCQRHAKVHCRRNDGGVRIYKREVLMLRRVGCCAKEAETAQDNSRILLSACLHHNETVMDCQILAIKSVDCTVLPCHTCTMLTMWGWSYESQDSDLDLEVFYGSALKLRSTPTHPVLSTLSCHCI
jgi:hypothetical protein